MKSENINALRKNKIRLDLVIQFRKMADLTQLGSDGVYDRS